MARIPEPEQTPDGPAYEGRLLDRPEEEVVDQGAGFDIKTLVSRRGVLSLVGVGVGAATLAACAPAATSSTSTTSTPSATSTPTESATATPTPTETAEAITLPSGEIPDETAGPYPGDGSNGPDVLEESGIVRSDVTTSIDGSATAEGVPLVFTITVTDTAGGDAPFEGVAVYAWHCDAQGRYSMYSSGVEDVTYLRGVQVADADGQVTFTSIFPACYSGRWPHIHFEVYPDESSISDSANAIATSQIAMPEETLSDVYALAAYDGSTSNLSQVSLASDNVFGDDGGALQTPTWSGDAENGYVISLVARVDTTTEPTAGAAPEGGGGQPPA